MLLVLLAGAGATTSASAQTRGQTGVFHAPHVANLPTPTTLADGHLLFEISHRFDAPISDGADALWGLDGGVLYRLGLAWGLTDRVTLGVLRSNLDDNLELNAKALLFDTGEDEAGSRFQVGAKGGIAWNTQPAFGAEDNERQSYLQLLLAAGLGERVSLGLAPAWLRNPRIQEPEVDDALVLGLQASVRVAPGVSFFGEWIASEERPELAHDSGALGLELETRGHFFKVLLTNQVRINPTQFLGGAPVPFEPGTWRVAFNILRLIPL